MRLFVYGAGGHGRVIADSLEAAGSIVAAFLVDASGRRMSGRWEVILAKEVSLGPDAAVALGGGRKFRVQRCTVGSLRLERQRRL